MTPGRRTRNVASIDGASKVSPRTNPLQRGADGESIPTLRESRYSQSLERGLAVLGCFTPKRHVLGIFEIADMLGMSRATTNRYVRTLAVLGFMEQTPNRKYRLGLQVTDLGMSALSATGLSEHAHPDIEELRHRSSFTVSLTVLDAHEIVYVDRARSFRRGQNKIDLNLRPGSRLPVYCTAMGKVLLAYLPDSEQLDVVTKMEMTKRTPNTIKTKKALLAELEQVAQEGMAVNDEELVTGLIAIAVPIRDETRQAIASISMAAHTDMISLAELVDHLFPHLLATADHISARVGYRRDDQVGG